MTLLTDTDIEKIITTNVNEWERKPEIKREKLLIANYEEKSLTPVGYDLGVGEQYLKMSGKVTNWDKLKVDEELTILPEEMVAIETEETIGMPLNKELSGILVSKVTIVEKGLSHVSTSVDADYHGKMIITCTNESKRNITLKRRQPFCTLIFFKNESPATRACGKSPSDHILRLLQDWQVVGRMRRRRITLLWIAKISLTAIPIVVVLLINFLVRPISAAEAAISVALSSLIFTILDKIFKTE